MAANEADAFLLEAVQKGDQQAWRDLIERYQGRLTSFARRMLAHRGDAEDLVQETFLGFLRSLPNFDHSRPLETYLFAILRHKLHDQFRKVQKGQRQSLDQLELEDTPEAWLDTETPSGHLVGKEKLAAQRAALVDCLRQWVDQCRTQQRFQDLIVVEMLMVLGLRNKEVAADLGLRETAVAGVKFRVLEQWRKLTGSAPGAPEWREADLARDSSVARIWREEGISCLKRSTMGRFLLGVLDQDWNTYIDFHVNMAGCDRCRANLDDLRSEDELDTKWRTRLRERCFTSSVGFLSRSPQ
ncbi:MAG: RNA polymerase sigma factor [Planctomycetes bacterium]|nr:RNA polymerase sigma factor [Planctomycetota bacterium]